MHYDSLPLNISLRNRPHYGETPKLAWNLVNRYVKEAGRKAGKLLVVALCPLFCTFASVAAIVPPTAPSESVKISLFASEPDIVTPIGATVDSHGRLLVIESNTHFPTPKYKGARLTESSCSKGPQVVIRQIESPRFTKANGG